MNFYNVEDLGYGLLKISYNGKYGLIHKSGYQVLPIDYYELDYLLMEIRQHLTKGGKAIFIIPLGDGEKYNIPRFEIDKTHKIKQTMFWWHKQMKRHGFKIIRIKDDMTRIKPNWNVPLGNVYIEVQNG